MRLIYRLHDVGDDEICMPFPPSLGGKRCLQMYDNLVNSVGLIV